MAYKGSSCHPKSLIKRQQQAEEKEQEKRKKKQAEEDAFWRDDNEKQARKDDRRLAKDLSKDAALEKKRQKELARLEEENLLESPAASAKIKATAKTAKNVSDTLRRVTELTFSGSNTAAMDSQRTFAEDEITAKDVEIMGSNEADDYLTYKNKNLQEVKAEFPNLNRTQLEDKIYKRWRKYKETQKASEKASKRSAYKNMRKN